MNQSYYKDSTLILGLIRDLNKNFVGYCCENPKGPHKFPKGHPKLSAEQNEKTQKANDAAEKAADSESTEFGVASKAADSESTECGVASTVGEDACDFETGGSACCNGKGLAVIGTKDYCLDLVKYGECAATQHACYATRLNKNFVGYCCENPKGPHKFPKGHPKLSAEQKEQALLI